MPTSATFARRSCSPQLFPGASKSLTSMADRLVLDSSERDDRHGALLDADMTADALILMEHQLKHGETGAPRSWTSIATPCREPRAARRRCCLATHHLSAADARR